jgi:uncharacterized protein
MHPYLQSALGGILIGLASWLLLFSLGRVAGVSGIAAGALVPSAPPGEARRADVTWRWAFVLGLVVGGLVMTWGVPLPAMAPRSTALLLVAGLLVGYGTVLGSGCTSGHGVCGMARGSGRSLVATLTFMGSGMATVFVATRLLG